MISPTKLILAGYDIWPNFIWSAYEKRIHIVIFAASFMELVGTGPLLIFLGLHSTNWKAPCPSTFLSVYIHAIRTQIAITQLKAIQI